MYFKATFHTANNDGNLYLTSGETNLSPMYISVYFLPNQIELLDIRSP